MGMRLHTRTLAAGQSMVITKDQNVLYFSYQMSSGDADAGTLLGDFPFQAANDVAAVNAAAIDVGPGSGAVFVTDPQRPLVLTVAAVNGTMNVIVGF